MLATEGLAKAFGPTPALVSCSFELRPGEVHAIVGENGSGKSTLVKILAGVHRPDAGSVVLGGLSARLGSPRAAIAAGVATVFQETLVVGARSVLDNVWLGADGLFRARLSGASKRVQAAEALGDLLETVPDLGTPVEELSLSDRQACCLARALARDPRILILDEATSALDVATRDRLFTVLRRLAGAGTGIVFISHRMDEIEAVADRVTVMRSGETVATLGRGEATASALVRLMTGAEQLTGSARERAALASPGQPVLELGDFTLRAGELVGLAGLEGHGQDAFLRALRGGRAAGPVAYVPRERRAEALFEPLSVRENFALPTLARDTTAGLLRPGRTQRRFLSYVRSLGIRVGSARDRVTTLSGGNQQKVVLARWLASSPAVLLLNDPTRGVDIGAKRDIYDLLARLTAEGLGVVMLSTELDELVELMDRVLVFREQSIFCELARASLSREALVAAFFGRSLAPPAPLLGEGGR